MIIIMILVFFPISLLFFYLTKSIIPNKLIRVVCSFLLFMILSILFIFIFLRDPPPEGTEPVDFNEMKTIREEHQLKTEKNEKLDENFNK